MTALLEPIVGDVTTEDTGRPVDRETAHRVEQFLFREARV